MSENNLRTPTDKERARSVAARVHPMMLLSLGLYVLLDLQYQHEGHRDEHVCELLSENMYAIELELSNAVQALAVEDVPF